MKNFFVNGLLIIAITLVLGGCPDGQDNGGQSNGGQNNGTDSSNWLWTNQKQYTVTDGVAGDISTETNTTWIKYKDDDHYESQSVSSTPYNTYNETGTYTVSTVGSSQSSSNSSRNGNTWQSTSHTITDITITYDYVDPSREDSITRTTSDITQTSTIVYDNDSGLTLSSTSETTGTQAGSPYNVNSENRYTIELLGTADGVKTYKYYNTTTGETNGYSLYKIRNGLTLEAKSYYTGDVLLQTTTNTYIDGILRETKTYIVNGDLTTTTSYALPENSSVRRKLPTLTLYSSEASYQTCEVVSDSNTELRIRIKTYTAAGVLTAQTETTYRRR